VIGTVSSEAKADVARTHGCDHTINYTHENVAQRVRELTDGVGVNVVFDSVGKDTFEASLDSLKRRGLMVCVGTASGPIPPFDPQMLALKGSLFLTRPPLLTMPQSLLKEDCLGRAFRSSRSGTHQD
jgi:NADPH2:quinone reductase